MPFLGYVISLYVNTNIFSMLQFLSIKIYIVLESRFSDICKNKKQQQQRKTRMFSYN